MNDSVPPTMNENCDECIQGVLVYHSTSMHFGVFQYGHTYAIQSIWIYDDICINEQGELVASYRWPDWGWEITDWGSRLHDNYPSFWRNLWNLPPLNKEWTQKTNTCNRLDLETLEFWPIFFPRTLICMYFGSGWGEHSIPGRIMLGFSKMPSRITLLHKVSVKHCEKLRVSSSSINKKRKPWMICLSSCHW